MEDNKNYAKFLNGINSLGLDVYELNKNWIYAGGFANTTNTDQQKVKDNALRLEWKNCMGDVEIPDDEPEDTCCCNTDIIYNYILLNKKLYDEKDEIEYIILGSECIKNFTEIKLIVYKTCEKKGCFEKHKNRKSNYCNIHRLDKKRCCDMCNIEIPKGKKRILGLYCSNFCKEEKNNKEIYFVINNSIEDDVIKCFKKLKIKYRKYHRQYILSFNDSIKLKDYFNKKHKYFNIFFEKVVYYDYKINKIAKDKITNNKVTTNKKKDVRFLDFNCVACQDTGIQYLSDGVYGECLCCDINPIKKN